MGHTDLDKFPVHKSENVSLPDGGNRVESSVVSGKNLGASELVWRLFAYVMIKQ